MRGRQGDRLKGYVKRVALAPYPSLTQLPDNPLCVIHGGLSRLAYTG